MGSTTRATTAGEYPDPGKGRTAKYIAYKSAPKSLTSRGFLVIEEDGSVDGRTMASELSEEDAVHIVNLLNKEEGEA